MGEFGLHQNQTERGEMQAQGWRGIASAWAIVLLILALFAGWDALASSRPAPAHDVGVVIPRHDPACDAAAFPALPKGCPGIAPAPLDRSAVPWG